MRVFVGGWSRHGPAIAPGHKCPGFRCPAVLYAQAEMYENRLSLSGRAGVDMRNHLQPRPTPCSYCLYHGDVAASQPQLMVRGSESS